MSYFAADETLEEPKSAQLARAARPAARTWPPSALFAADEQLEAPSALPAPAPAPGLQPPARARTQQPPPALPGLDEVDRALAGNSALLAVNGVFVKETKRRRR